MNIYLILAIALGAITGATELPVARAAFAGTVAESAVRVCEQAAPDNRQRPRHSIDEARPARFVSAPSPALQVPLTGAATPRAPASIR